MKYKIIKSLSQYNEYCDKHEALILKDESKYSDEIELLELLIEDYDQRMMRERSTELNPVELLRTLMRDADISQTELSNVLNVSRQLVNDILGYRRNISKGMMIKLSNYFSMNQEAFGRKYYLKKNKVALQSGKKAMGNN